MARFRLRFLLQEFDIVGPELVIGRSPDCQITIEDPLVSRRHARMRVQGQVVSIADLGSRNGVRVNGKLIKGEHSLSDRDRIRLGTQELVFFVVEKQERAARPTGYMRVCQACGTPFPEVAPQCPHCGAFAAPEEETISGLVVEPKKSWTFQLLGEVIERAIATGRAAEAERVMKRAVKEVEERLAQGDRLDPAQVGLIASFAVRLARLTGSSEWVDWAFTIHRQQGRVISVGVLERIEQLDIAAHPDLPQIVSGFLSWARTRGNAPGPDEQECIARLERLTRP